MCQVQVPANVRAGTLSLLTGALEIKPLMLQVTPVYSAEMSQKYQEPESDVRRSGFTQVRCENV